MTTNTAITVWHYNDDSEVYERKTFKEAWACNSRKKLEESKGRTSKNICKIRIPTMNDIELQLGDYVRLGIHNDEQPERGKDMAVCELADNRRGSMPHWRVLCE